MRKKRKAEKERKIIINSLRMVEVEFVDGKKCSYEMYKNDVNKFIEATLRLYDHPGINPYNREETTRINYISVSKPIAFEGYWWTDPNLHSIDDSAKILVWGGTYYAFVSPEQEEKWKEESKINIEGLKVDFSDLDKTLGKLGLKDKLKEKKPPCYTREKSYTGFGTQFSVKEWRAFYKRNPDFPATDSMLLEVERKAVDERITLDEAWGRLREQLKKEKK